MTVAKEPEQTTGKAEEGAGAGRYETTDDKGQEGMEEGAEDEETAEERREDTEKDKEATEEATKGNKG